MMTAAGRGSANRSSESYCSRRPSAFSKMMRTLALALALALVVRGEASEMSRTSAVVKGTPQVAKAKSSRRLFRPARRKDALGREVDGIGNAIRRAGSAESHIYVAEG